MKIVYVDMDHVLFDYEKGHGEHKKRYPEIEYPQSIEGFFYSLDPLPGAIEGYRWLMEHPMVDEYILTAPSYMNPLSYTDKRKSIEKYFGLDACRKLILSPNKGLSKGHFLIDDNVEGKGQEDFEGELIQFGSEQYPDWDSVIAYLDSRFSLR